MFKELRDSFKNDEWIQKDTFIIEHKNSKIQLWTMGPCWFTGFNCKSTHGKCFYIPGYMRHILYFYYLMMKRRAAKARRMNSLPDKFIKKG